MTDKIQNQTAATFADFRDQLLNGVDYTNTVDDSLVFIKGTLGSYRKNKVLGGKCLEKEMFRLMCAVNHNLWAFDYLNELIDLPAEIYWPWLASYYMGSDSFGTFSADRDALLEKLFLKQKDITDRQNLVMNQEEKAFFDDLPDEFTVYRGQDKHWLDIGWSWTLSKDVAQFFADRGVNEGVVLTMNIKKTDVIAYFNDREEQEIVICPEDKEAVPLAHFESNEAA